MARSKLDPNNLDAGICDAVILLHRAGFKAFTSCEGGIASATQPLVWNSTATANHSRRDSSSIFIRKVSRFSRSA